MIFRYQIQTPSFFFGVWHEKSQNSAARNTVVLSRKHQSHIIFGPGTPPNLKVRDLMDTPSTKRCGDVEPNQQSRNFSN